MVLMQPQVSGLACGADPVRPGTVPGHRQGPWGALVWHWVTGRTAPLPLHPVSLPPGAQRSPNMGTPVSLAPWRAGRVSPIFGCSRAVPGQAGPVWQSPCPGAEQGWCDIPRVPTVVQGWHSVPGAVQGRCVVSCAVQGWCGGPHVLVLCRTSVVSPVSPMPLLLSLPRACVRREAAPAQSPHHPNLLQVLLLPWPLRAACRDRDDTWPVPSAVPTHPSPIPAGPGTQLVLLWQRPAVLVPECHHLLPHPSPSQPCSAASPAPAALPLQSPPAAGHCLAGWLDGCGGRQCSLCRQPARLSLASLALGRFLSRAWTLAPCPGWAARLQLCRTPQCRCQAALVPFPHGTRPSCLAAGLCAQQRVPCSRPGCTSTSGHDSGAGGPVRGTGWESTEQGLSPCQQRPHVPVPRVPPVLPALRGTRKICNLALLSG